MTTLVDTNVVLDVTTPGSASLDWSADRIVDAAGTGPLFINDVIYAEVSVGYTSIQALDEALRSLGFHHLPTPKEALFRAGKAFGTYRARGGTRPGVLPDFFIGAHASVEGLSLLTRDPARYRTYFPDAVLIAPS